MLENRDWWKGLGLKFSLLSRMATLGVSFGLVACLLGLVLSFCFATEFSVSEWSKGVQGTQPQPSDLSFPCSLARGSSWVLSHLQDN